MSINTSPIDDAASPSASSREPADQTNQAKVAMDNPFIAALAG
jgi:hypothetical protein